MRIEDLPAGAAIDDAMWLYVYTQATQGVNAMRYTHTAIAALIMMTGYTASAADLTVFEMQLQQPFAVPECPYTHITKTVGMYSGAQKAMCYELIGDVGAGKNTAITNDTVLIKWPTMGAPRLLGAPFFAMAKIMNGTLEGVSFNTRGIQSQQSDMQALSDKFGKPTSADQPSLQNAFGAKYQSVRAAWDFGEIVVSYDSAPSSVNSGLVIVDSLKSSADRKAVLEKLAHRGPSL
jgi:hypothetical protein